MPATAIPVTTAKEVFLVLLSHVRYYHERSSHIYQELGKAVNDPQVKEALEARAFITEKVLATVDQCFKVIGEKPVEFTGRLQEVFIDDFRKELAGIESPVAKKIFVLAKLVHITHARIGELAALTAAADAADLERHQARDRRDQSSAQAGLAGATRRIGYDGGPCTASGKTSEGTYLRRRHATTGQDRKSV